MGVVEDVRSRALDEEAVLQYYALHEALPWATAMYVVLRTAGDPLALVGPLRAAVREIDPDQPLGEIASMSGRLRESVASPRFRTTLIGAFAGLATFLALVGIYGVLGYSVATRTREFGVRMAVGASGGGVQGLVITEGLRLVALGLVLGLLAAGVATRVLESLLFEVSALDPGTFAAAGGLLAGVALLATWIPARRASRVDPLTAIRTD